MKPLTNLPEKKHTSLKPVKPLKDSEHGELSQAEQVFFDIPDRKKIGQWAEDLAADYLATRGLRILARNVRDRFSELDIVALDGNELVFGEVRCRRKNSMMSAEETLGPQKLKKIMRGAELFALKNHWKGPVRVDLIAVDVDIPCWSLRWIRYLEMGEYSYHGC